MLECVLHDYVFVMNKIRIHSLNMRGGRDVWKRRSVFEYLKSLNANIIILQECHILDEDFKDWEEEWGGRKNIYKPFDSEECRAGNFIERKNGKCRT